MTRTPNLATRTTRRRALTDLAIAASCAASWRASWADETGPKESGAHLHVATNTYPWRTFAQRSGSTFRRHTDTLLADIAATGVDGYEPIVDSADELQGLARRLNRHGLSMKSIYVNSELHDASRSRQSADQVVEIAAAAKTLGTRIVVTNPSPIRWGGDEDKSDPQLRHQAESLDRLGRRLGDQGMTLAYHNHDAELRQGGREFHHMLTATDPDHVKLCLDAHWIFRGCGDSQVALFDAVSRYHDRIVELHLRQSHGGIWDEAFSSSGDIDYVRLFRELRGANINPHVVLEQAVESRSEQSMSVTDAHRQGCRSVRKAFG